MANTLFLKEQAFTTLGSTGTLMGTTIAGTPGSNSTLDCRAAGNAAEVAVAWFQLKAVFGTTGPVAGSNLGDLYLVPALDGTNYPDVTTASAGVPSACYVGSFIADDTIGTSATIVAVAGAIELFPLLYQPYLVNKSGVTMNANWSLGVLPAQGSYT